MKCTFFQSKSKMILSILALAFLSSCPLWMSCSIRPQSAIAEVPPEYRHQFNAEDIQAPEYRLGYGDVIEVKFFNESQFNETVPVRPDGRISLQRVGDIEVIGITPNELDSIVTGTYKKILINPDVTVIVKEFGGQQFYVMGEVEKPGAYSMERGMTLLRAIATAGGPKFGASLKSVIYIRNTGKHQVKANRFDISLSAIKENPNADIPIRAYDMIYVPKTFIADVNAFVSHIYDVVLPPVDVYTRYKYWYSR